MNIGLIIILGFFAFIAATVFAACSDSSHKTPDFYVNRELSESLAEKLQEKGFDALVLFEGRFHSLSNCCVVVSDEGFDRDIAAETISSFMHHTLMMSSFFSVTVNILSKDDFVLFNNSVSLANGVSFWENQLDDYHVETFEVYLDS